MAGVWGQLERASGRGNSFTFPLPEPERISVADVLERAESAAAGLRAAVRSPERVAILMSNGEPFVRALFACFRLGAAAVPLALPIAFGGPEAYARHIRRIVEDAAVGCILLDDTTAALGDRLQEVLPGVEVLHVDELRGNGPVDMVTSGEGDDLAVIQYTSGSTSAPKGVALTHDNVCAGLVPITGDWNWTGDDVVGLWLPLFHDMGLFALLSALVQGSDAYLWKSTDFVRRGHDWLTSFAQSPVTIMPQPNFAYDYMVRTAADGIPKHIDLSHWRAAVNGAETIQRATVESFARTFGPYGFDPEAMKPVYGLAEATLAVAFPHVAAPPRFEHVSRGTLVEGDAVTRGRDGDRDVRSVASVGTAVTGIELRIGTAGGDSLGEGRVGEVQIRGAAVMRGYLGVPEERQPFTADGWLRTGDLAFQLDGELFIVGRIKDMVILQGRNYYPEDVEEIIRKVPAVTRRHCVALGLEVDGQETMIVLFETKLEGSEAGDAAQEIRYAIASQLGLSAVEAIPVPPRTIPHTPSGKVKRTAARALCEERALEAASRGWTAEGVR